MVATASELSLGRKQMASDYLSKYSPGKINLAMWEWSAYVEVEGLSIRPKERLLFLKSSGDTAQDFAWTICLNNANSLRRYCGSLQTWISSEFCNCWNLHSRWVYVPWTDSCLWEPGVLKGLPNCSRILENCMSASSHLSHLGHLSPFQGD